MTASHPPAATGQRLNEKLDKLSQQVAELTRHIKQLRLENLAALNRLPPPAEAPQEREHGA